MTEQRSLQKIAFKRSLILYPEWTSLTEKQQEDIVRKIERCCYNHTVITCTQEFIACLWDNPKFIQRYSAECYRIIGNLDFRTTDGALGRNVFSGVVDVNKICDLSSYDLNPSATQAEVDEINLRIRQHVDKKYSTDVCEKCQSQTVLRVKVQTRAADELASFHYKCDTCNNTWGT